MFIFDFTCWRATNWASSASWLTQEVSDLDLAYGLDIVSVGSSACSYVILFEQAWICQD